MNAAEEGAAAGRALRKQLQAEFHAKIGRGCRCKPPVPGRIYLGVVQCVACSRPIV